MTKRKATTASKPARSVKVTAKAQRATSAVIKSPRPSRVRAFPAGPIKSSPNGPKQEAAAIESLATAPLKQLISEPILGKGFDFSSATATARAYQAKLLEMTQANMQFALEFGPRFASIRSPAQLVRLIEELTKERIAMFRKYSNEMVELNLKR